MRRQELSGSVQANQSSTRSSSGSRRSPGSPCRRSPSRATRTARELFADAPEVGRTALEKVLSRLAWDASQALPPPVESACRAGSRLGKVSELTIIVPFAPGGAQRLRAFLRLFGGNLAGVIR